MLDALPLNANGKLEHKALLKPYLEEAREYIIPSTPEARQLAEIWQKVLGVERISESDNFQHRYSSLETMADDYVETIRHIQPEGPYRLLGWSLGGASAESLQASSSQFGWASQLCWAEYSFAHHNGGQAALLGKY